MSVICLINKRANSDFQQEAHPRREILKAKTEPRPSPEVSPEVTGGAYVIPKASWAEFQEAGPQGGGLAGSNQLAQASSVHQHPSPRRQETGVLTQLAFSHAQLETQLICS